MENAIKALLIAAGILISIMVLSLVVVVWDQISAYQTEKHISKMVEQTTKFNNRFENYNRKNIRGTDMISLMNRVIDYNATESYLEGTGYQRIGVTIEIGEDNIPQFKYQEEDYNKWDANEFLLPIITNETGTASVINDKKLVEITSTVPTLATYMGANLTDTDFQKIASNISNILLSSSDETSNTKSAQATRQKRYKVLKSVGIQLDVDSEYKSTNQLQIDKVKQITNKYYQYMQFKRAYFDCIEMNYDAETGRVVDMYFKLQTIDNKVVFN